MLPNDHAARCAACARCPVRSGDVHDPDCVYGADVDLAVYLDAATLADHPGMLRRRRPVHVEYLEVLRGDAHVDVELLTSRDQWAVFAQLVDGRLRRTLYCGVRPVAVLDVPVEVSA